MINAKSTSCHVAGDRSQSVEQFCLHARFHKKQIYMDLLGVLELPPEALIHSFGGFLRAAHHGLNVDLKAAV